MKKRGGQRVKEKKDDREWGKWRTKSKRGRRKLKSRRKTKGER